jgi:RIO-like serine/threonine protein kinase
MTLTELLYTEVIPAIKAGDKSTIIGEGTQAEIYDRFICKSHKDICFKVFYPKGERAADEYAVLLKLQGLSVPKALELFEDANAYAMEKVHGITLEQAIQRKLKLSPEVIEVMTEALDEVTRLIRHGDLSMRNVMFGDLEIANGVLVDAVPYVIDFGHSTIKEIPSKSEEGLNVIKVMKALASA